MNAGKLLKKGGNQLKELNLSLEKYGLPLFPEIKNIT